MASSYTKKIIISGHVVEVYEYLQPILEGYTDTKKTTKGRKKSVNKNDDEIEQNNYRDQVLNRAKRNLRRLINCNGDSMSKFVTLTFKENVTDLDIANREFKKFIQRLNRFTKLERGVQYACVIEFMKNGRVHYHVIFFNLPYIKNADLRKIWGQGWVRINRVDNVDNLGSYVVKYMNKDADDERLKGRKSYLTSKGLYKPKEIKEDERVQVLADALTSSGVDCYTATYDIKDTEGNILNGVTYRQYNMKRMKKEL